MHINADILRTGWSAYTRAARLNRAPAHLHLEPTNYCNYDCIMCYHKKVIPNPTHMDFDLFVRIIDQFRPSFVSLNGYGEPLMAPRFFDMTAHLKQRRIPCNTTTNGSLIHNHIPDILASGLVLISISIDAATAETYAAVRRNDKFEKVLDNIRWLIRDRGGAKTPLVRATFVAQKNNLHEMAPFIRLGANLGLDNIMFQPYIELEKQAGNARDTSAGIEKKQFLEKLQEAQSTARGLNMPTNLPFIIRRLDDYFRVQYLKEPDPAVLRRCVKPWLSLYVTAEGHVRPCCSFAPIPTNTGDISQENIQDILNNPAMTRFRTSLKQGKAPHWLCERCMPLTFWENARGSIG